MQHDIYVYLLLMSAVTIAIRVVPVTLLRREIISRLLRSFLFYVPYVTLAVMTFPAITEATQTPVSGTLALVGGILLALARASLFQVSAACCAIVFIAELLL